MVIVKVTYPTVLVPTKSGKDFNGLLHGITKDGGLIVEDSNGQVHVVTRDICTALVGNIETVLED